MVFQLSRQDLWLKIKDLQGGKVSPTTWPVNKFLQHAEEAFFVLLEVPKENVEPAALSEISDFLQGFVHNFKKFV